MGYNGWTNYPTWNVALWLDNDESTYYAVRQTLDGVRGKANRADVLRDFVEELAGDDVTEASFVSDLLGWSFDQVEWSEIAAHYRQEEREMRAESGAVSAHAIAILALVAGFAYLAAHVVAFAMRAMDAAANGIGG